MFKAKITEMLGIEYPIIGGTMMYLSTEEFVAAISNAGALGILASAIYQSKDEFRTALRRLKDLTDKPFAVNLSLFPAMRPIAPEEYVEVILEEGVKIVETSGHKAPEDLIEKLKKNNVTMIHKCVGIRYAKKAESLGVDAVTVVGYENGGATGRLDITTLCLVPRVVDAVNLPVIGGGGIADGRGVSAVLALGAEAVIVGTCLMATDECPLHDNVKQGLVGASELDTMIIMRSIENTHRVWINDAAKKVAEMEARKAGLDELLTVITGENAKAMYDKGDVAKGMLSCGQGVGLVTKVRPVRDLVQEMMAQAEESLKRLS